MVGVIPYSIYDTETEKITNEAGKWGVGWGWGWGWVGGWVVAEYVSQSYVAREKTSTQEHVSPHYAGCNSGKTGTMCTPLPKLHCG